MISAANTTAYFLLTDCFKAEETLLDLNMAPTESRDYYNTWTTSQRSRVIPA